MIKLSIIIPAFNEESTVSSVLKKLYALKLKCSKINIELIVIDDCSTDNTLSEIKKFSFIDKIISNKINSGKGYSVKRGLEFATGEYIIFQDADNEYDPLEIEKFIEIIDKFDPDIILGSRFNYNLYTRSHNIFNKFGNFLITNFFNILFNTTFNDLYCCYMCFKKKLLNISEIKTTGFEQHAEIICNIIKKSKKLYEVPINYNGRSIEEGKKIRYYHIFSVIYQIFKGRF